MSIRVQTGSTENEKASRAELLQRLQNSPIPEAELMMNLGLFMNRQLLTRIKFIDHLYQQIIPVVGSVMEFGVRWGQNQALLQNLRGIYEPFNYNRKIIGFDTFEGFPSVSDEDGSHVQEGDYAVTAGYEEVLEQILAYHESESPIPHKRKFELVKGDASTTLAHYLERHPETIVALAYFDFDIYQPTRDCLKLLSQHWTKGSVIAFDELNFDKFPGETLALKEVLGLDRYALRQMPNNPLCGYFVVS